ncbi:ATP-dependent DNA helicase [Trichonephila clavipes]|nr:ATP-dependent DNA helicase [Trichonephila clavipes]
MSVRAVAAASSGITMTQLTGSRTAQYALKLPLNHAQEVSLICNFNKNSSRGNLYRQNIVVGMILILASDSRRTISVIQKGTLAYEIRVCNKSSRLWVKVEKFSLKTNMSMHLHNDVDSGHYAEMPLEIRDE